MAVSENKVRGLAYIEKIWWETGAIPTFAKIADVVGVSESVVRSWFKDDNFREALKRRGVQLVAGEDEHVLTLDQLTLAAIMTSTADKRSMREKLEEAGITVQQMNSWMRDPRFQDHIKKRVQAMFNDADSIAYLTVLKNMEAGSMEATKFFLEMRGLYTPKMKLDVDIHSVLINIVEIIQRHVRDPLVIQAIAQDIENIPGVSPQNQMVEAQVIKPEVMMKSTVPEL